MKLKKGSAAAKAYMAKIRAKRKKVKKSAIAKPKRAAKKAVKAARKKAAKKVTSMHKDTKSHNVRISVMSGVESVYKNKNITKNYIDMKTGWYYFKPYTLSDLKKIHSDFFRKGYKQFFAIKGSKIVKGSLGHGLFYVEKIQYPGQNAEYTSRKINPDGSFSNTKRFNNFLDLSNEVKNTSFKF